MNDPLIGTTYCDAGYFKSHAPEFGCGGAIITTYSDTEISGALAAASRLIEAYTNRDYSVNPQVETQHVDLLTRRIRVNKPRVASIASMVLETYPTPTTLDVSQVYVNNQQNYIEIPTGQLALNSPIGAVEYPDITITYNTTQAMPPKSVIVAVGLTGAALLIQDYATRKIPYGLNEVSTEDQTISRDTSFNPFNTGVIPQSAKDVLAGDTVSSKRIVPQGYPGRTLEGLPQNSIPTLNRWGW